MSLVDGNRCVVAVVGCQRSGSTLTGQILGAGAHSVLLDELEGLYDWFHAIGSDREQALESDLLKGAAAKYRVPATRFAADGGSLNASVRNLVLKAPNLTYDFERLAALPAPLRVVYPVRDPRAVVASMTRLEHIDMIGNQRRLMESRPAIAALYESELAVLRDESAPPWIRRATVWKIKSGRAQALRDLGVVPFQFRYEDLVADPGAVIESLAHFCGMRDVTAMLNPQTAYVGFGPGGTDRTRAIDGDSRDAWRDVLTPDRADEILRIAGKLAEQFHYG